ncbi:MAG TPA: hypothetical protein VGG22_06330 [Candidatus Baltobacteraceae bacterium]
MTNYFDRINIFDERTVDLQTILKAPLFVNDAKPIAEEPLKVEMPPHDWHFGVVFQIADDSGLRQSADIVVARFRIILSAGDIRVGCVDPTSAFLVGDELELAARPELQTVEVEIPPDAGSIVFRTGLTATSRAPILQFDCWQVVVGKRAAAVSVTDVLCDSASRVESTSIPVAVAEVELLISHSTRRFDHRRSSTEFLRARYADRERLRNLPAFETLASASTAHSLHGALTHVRLSASGGDLSLEPIRCIDSRELIQQAALVGTRLVICSNGFMCVLPALDYRLRGDEFDRGSPFRIDDPWFAGLHTVVGIDSDSCLVSAAGPDAVLWVDLESRRVTHRFRLPEDRYGSNYPVTLETSVNEHYIPNDYQLGHLNSAFPDRHGGCYFTTLGQGDVAHVDRNGKWEIIASGYIGLHGLRESLDRTFLYFSESPTGKLWKIAHGSVYLMADIETKWLHDSQQISPTLFACLSVDRNELLLIDTLSGKESAAFDLSSRGHNPQFLSLVSQGT